MAVTVMRMKGTMKVTRHATRGVNPCLWTRESKIAGITKLQWVSRGKREIFSGYSLSNATTRVTPTTNEGVGGSDDVTVEESSGPDLAWDKGSAKNTDEETDSVEAGCIVCSTSERRWNGTAKQGSDECQTGTESVAKRASNGTNDEGGSQSDDVGVGDLILRKTKIFPDGDA